MVPVRVRVLLRGPESGKVSFAPGHRDGPCGAGIYIVAGVTPVPGVAYA